MHRVLGPLLFLFIVLRATPAITQGGPSAGKTLWEGGASQCRFCHGVNGQGGFGPDLAGRQLTLDEFKRAIRQPWGVMPAFTPSQLSDQYIADFHAYLTSLPKAKEIASWRVELPAGASLGQKMAIAGAGCVQCHGVAMDGARWDIGAIDADFEWFKTMVYEHDTAMPRHRILIGEPVAPVRMGNFSPNRLPESLLQEIWNYTLSFGKRAAVAGELSGAVSGPNGVTHTLTLQNFGLVRKGLTAENLTIALTIAPGFTVTSTTGAGYQGVRRDQQANADTAVWQVAGLGPKDKQTYTITLEGAGSGPAIPRGVVRWTNPGQPGGSDQLNVTSAR